MLGSKWTTYCICTGYTKTFYSCPLEQCVFNFCVHVTFLPVTMCNHPVYFYSSVLSALTNCNSYVKVTAFWDVMPWALYYDYSPVRYDTTQSVFYFITSVVLTWSATVVNTWKFLLILFLAFKSTVHMFYGNLFCS